MKWNGFKITDTHFFFGKTNPFLRFYKKIENDAPFLVYCTEVQKSNLAPHFKEFEMNLGKLANGDKDAPIQVELWDYNSNGSHEYMG